MWWGFYLFAVSCKLQEGAPLAAAAVQPTLAGPVLLSLLFQGSTPFTENITLRKYPGAARRGDAASLARARIATALTD